MAELHEILVGRDDGPALLAEVAGVLLGFSEGAIDEPKARVAAQPAWPRRPIAPAGQPGQG